MRRRPQNEEGRETMKLNAEQMKQFEEEGYIFIPEAFSPDEVELMRQAALDMRDNLRVAVYR